MQLLKFNGNVLDIDDDTVIGIDIQTWDIKDPSSIKINGSNNFSIPKTVTNLSFLGFPGEQYVGSKIIYDSFNFEYSLNNYRIINGIAYISSITKDRINITMVDKGASKFWDQAQNIKFTDFEKNYLAFLKEEGNIALSYDTIDLLLADVIGLQSDSPVGLYLPYFFSNASQDIDVNTNYSQYENAIDNSDTYSMLLGLENIPESNYAPDRINARFIQTGHLCAYVKHLFYFLENYDYLNPDTNENIKINTNFKTIDVAGGGNRLPGNVFNQTIAKDIYIPLRNICIIRGNKGDTYNDKFVICHSSQIDTYNDNFKFPSGLIDDKITYTPLSIKNSDVFKDKTVSDFVKGYVLLTNSMMNIQYDSESMQYGYQIRMFDYLLKNDSQASAQNGGNSQVSNYSNLITDDIEFSPLIDNLKQKNYIKYKSIADDKTGYNFENTYKNCKFLPCNNKNLELGKEEDKYLEIDGYSASFKYVKHIIDVNSSNYSHVHDLSTDNSFRLFNWMVDKSKNPIGTSSTNNTIDCDVKYVRSFITPSVFSDTVNLNIASTVNIDKFYNIYNSCIVYPEVYTVYKYMSYTDIYQFDFFRRIWIDKLGSYFFINKIESYNPNSNEPTKIELLRLKQYDENGIEIIEDIKSNIEY